MKTNTFIYQYARSFVNNCSHFQAVIFYNNMLITISGIICYSTSINKSSCYKNNNSNNNTISN